MENYLHCRRVERKLSILILLLHVIKVLEAKNHWLLLCYCDEDVSVTEVQWNTQLTLKESCISACLKYIVWDCKAFRVLLIFENEEHPLKILLSACCIKRVCLTVQFGIIPGALDSSLSSPEDANKPLLNLGYHGCCLRDLANGWLIKRYTKCSHITLPLEMLNMYLKHMAYCL